MDNKKSVRQPEKKEKNMSVTGTVVNCEKLRVRAKPSKDSNVLALIDVGDQVEINEKRSTEDFYSVTVKEYTGYCMKDFIHVKE